MSVETAHEGAAVRTTLPWMPRWAAEDVDEVLAASLFPLLIISVICNQPRPFPLIGPIGQLASIGGTVVAIALVARALPTRLWPMALVGALLLTRGLRLLAADPPWLVLLYTAFGAILYSAAGVCVVSIRPLLLRKQFAILCAVSVPIMVGQIIGLEWLQVLRTDVEANATRGSFPTLFVPADQIVLTGLQARPAGLLYANNVFSIIVLMGLGLYFSRTDGRRVTWSDGAVLAVIVLLMAKIALLGLAVMMLIRLSWGRDARVHTLSCVAVFLVLLATYRLLFPGLFVYNLGYEVWAVNFQTRLADLLIATRVPGLVELAERFPYAILTRLNAGGATQSGYAQLMERGRSLLPTFVVALPYFWLALKAWSRFDRDTRHEVIAAGAMLCLAPLITPYFGSLLFWFLAGAALRPFWAILNSGLPLPRRGSVSTQPA